MFITKKKHLAIVAAKDMEIQRLRENRDLAELLRGITNKLNGHDGLLTCVSGTMGWANAVELNLPTDVPRLLDDHFGGKVFKHLATKVVVLDTEGNAKTAWTARKADKGFKYVLDRRAV